MTFSSAPLSHSPSIAPRHIFYATLCLSLALHIVAGVYLPGLKKSSAPATPKPLEIVLEPPRIPPVEVKPHIAEPRPITPQPKRPWPAVTPAKVPPLVKPTVQPARASAIATPVLAVAPTQSPAPTVPSQTVVPVTPREPPAKAAEEPYNAPLFDAAYLSNPQPRYPEMARKRGITGTVKLRVKVDATGKPVKVTVEETSESSSLDDAALNTVSERWRFVPARRGEVNVPGEVIVPIRFSVDR